MVVPEKTLESPLGCKEVKPISPKGNQSWIFIGRTDAEAEAPILWPHDAKSRFTGKYPDTGKDWRQKKKGGQQRRRWLDSITDSTDMTEQTPGDSEGQGSLACYSPWGCKESDMTEPLNNNKESQRNWFLITMIQKVDRFFEIRSLRMKVVCTNQFYKLHF